MSKPLILHPAEIPLALAGTLPGVWRPVELRGGYDGSGVYETSDGVVRPVETLCPLGGVGAEVWVKEPLWISECGQYYARPVDGVSRVELDILATDGSRVWIRDQVILDPEQPRGWRYQRPEHPHRTSSWTNRGRWKRGYREWVPAFDMTFRDVELGTDPYIAPALQRYEAQFRKQQAAQRMPAWASRLRLRITSVRVERLTDPPAWWDERCKRYPAASQPWCWVRGVEVVTTGGNE